MHPCVQKVRYQWQKVKFQDIERDMSTIGWEYLRKVLNCASHHLGFARSISFVFINIPLNTDPSIHTNPFAEFNETTDAL